MHCLGLTKLHHSRASSMLLSSRLITWAGFRWRLKPAKIAAQSLLPLLLFPTTIRGRDPGLSSLSGVRTWLMIRLRGEETVLLCLDTTVSGGMISLLARTIRTIWKIFLIIQVTCVCHSCISQVPARGTPCALLPDTRYIANLSTQVHLQQPHHKQYTWEFG